MFDATRGALLRVLPGGRPTRAERDLPRLKPDERRALGLLAAGHSYKEICAIRGWTYTKGNRRPVPPQRPAHRRRASEAFKPE